jgi:DnaA family protein
MKHAGTQWPLGVGLPDAASFDAFYPGPNEEVLATVRRLSEGRVPGSRFLWGMPGSGKTHLLQAACRELSEAGGVVAYLPLRDMADEPPLILEGLADRHLLCLDDVEAVAGGLSWETALVALIDRLRHNGGSLLVAGSAVPAECGFSLPDLVSRLGWGGLYGLQPLDDPGRIAALQLRAGQRGLKLPVEVASYLLTRTPRNMPALIDLLERLDHASLAAKRRLTVPFVREVLGLKY